MRILIARLRRCLHKFQYRRFVRQFDSGDRRQTQLIERQKRLFKYPEVRSLALEIYEARDKQRHEAAMAALAKGR